MPSVIETVYGTPRGPEGTLRLHVHRGTTTRTIGLRTTASDLPLQGEVSPQVLTGTGSGTKRQIVKRSFSDRGEELRRHEVEILTVGVPQSPGVPGGPPVGTSSSSRM